MKVAAHLLVLCKQLMLPVVNGWRVVLGLGELVEACAGPSPIHPIFMSAPYQDYGGMRSKTYWFDEFVHKFI